MQETSSPPPKKLSAMEQNIFDVDGQEKKLSGIARAVLKAGGQAALARLLTKKTKTPLNPIAVYYWVRKGYVPVKHLMAVSGVTGIPIKDLLPKPLPPTE